MQVNAAHIGTVICHVGERQLFVREEDAHEKGIDQGAQTPINFYEPA